MTAYKVAVVKIVMNSVINTINVDDNTTLFTPNDLCIDC